MLQKTLKIILINIIFIVFCATINSQVLSKEFYELQIPDEINIILSKKNFGKYLKYQMDALLDGSNEEKNNILRKYKKSIKATIVLKEKKLNSKVSITGEWKDHLKFPYTSLKVEILGENNFYNVKKFKLFLPETRFAENEIFWTMMLKKIGFPVFHTKFVKVKLNNINYIALFQEDSSKEFLERNGLRETVILRNDDFHFHNSVADGVFYDLAFSRSWLVDNENFIKDSNPYSTQIVSKAIANYSNPNFFKNVKDNKLFELILGKYGTHGLVHFNRKYIYEPYYNNYIPLYYDGMTSTNLEQLLGKNYKCDYFSSDNKLAEFSTEFKKLSGFDLDKDKKCIFHEIMSKSETYKNDLLEENYFDQAAFNGYQNQYRNYNKIKKIILEKINFKELTVKELKSNDSNNHIYTFEYKNKYYICLYNMQSDKIQFSEIKLEEYNDYISSNNIFVYSGRFIVNLGLIEIDRNESISNNLNTNSKNLYLTKPITYIINSNELVKKEYNIYFQNNQARLLIHKNILKNKTLNFYNNKDLKNTNLDIISRFNGDLLTGCVTIIDAKIIDLNLNSNNMFCEDSINIIRSEGNINNLNIYNSKFDALDLDFSDILIKNVKVENAGNDCIDLSFGNYNILNSRLNGCYDKGFSVGEKSDAYITNAIILNTNIGLAAKDESKVFIDEFKATNITSYCLAAYMKKSEFYGATIKYKNIICDKNNYFDNKSLIINEKD
ncbi:hypothetical protein OAJ95_00940 [Pelagibacteraceae bacterium]|nr:hypothetical protein [Pelagibacteraceae bacterium]